MTGQGPRTLDWRWQVIKILVVPVFKLLGWRIDVRDVHHVPSEGGAVLAFNHHSYADAIMLAWGVVLYAGRPLRFLAKREACEGRWIGWLTRWVAAIPVDRASSSARAAALTEAEAALRAGDLVTIAPEQTISDSLELLPFRLGAARLAIATGVPIVPCIGWGSQRSIGPDRRLAKVLRLPVIVRFGAPMRPLEGEDATAFTRRLRATMRTMLDEVQRSYPDGTPAGAPWVPARLGGGAPAHEEVLALHRAQIREWGERLDADESSEAADAAQAPAAPAVPDAPEEHDR
jgi:1-acyl-sn-glycerol-3-phosphate acyltransferase